MKKNIGVYVLVAVIFLILGYLGGTLVEKSLNKDNNKTENNQQENNEQVPENNDSNKVEQNVNYSTNKEISNYSAYANGNVLEFRNEDGSIKNKYTFDSEIVAIEHIYTGNGGCAATAILTKNGELYYNTDVGYIKHGGVCYDVKQEKISADFKVKGIENLIGEAEYFIVAYNEKGESYKINYNNDSNNVDFKLERISGTQIVFDVENIIAAGARVDLNNKLEYHLYNGNPITLSNTNNIWYTDEEVRIYFLDQNNKLYYCERTKKDLILYSDVSAKEFKVNNNVLTITFEDKTEKEIKINNRRAEYNFK